MRHIRVHDIRYRGDPTSDLRRLSRSSHEPASQPTFPISPSYAKGRR